MPLSKGSAGLHKPVLSVVHEDYRRCLLQRFPYAVFYEYSGSTVIVYSVFHTSRNPDKWRARLPWAELLQIGVSHAREQHPSLELFPPIGDLRPKSARSSTFSPHEAGAITGQAFSIDGGTLA